MIATPRLILRPLEDRDRDTIAAINGDPRVSDWLGGPIDRAASDAMVDRVMAHFATQGFGLWAIERKEDEAVIGLAGLLILNAALPTAPGIDLGWRLAPEAWGHGYAAEAARAALDWGFASRDFAEVIAMTASTNARSEAVMQRLGMVRAAERDFDHPALAPDHPLRRHIVYVAKRPD